jgi:hypothetical protein
VEGEEDSISEKTASKATPRRNLAPAFRKIRDANQDVNVEATNKAALPLSSTTFSQDIEVHILT